MLAQTSVRVKDSLFVLVDRLTAQLLALGAGGAVCATERAHNNQSRRTPRLSRRGDRLWRGAFQTATPLLERAVSCDSTFALALSPG